MGNRSARGSHRWGWGRTAGDVVPAVYGKELIPQPVSSQANDKAALNWSIRSPVQVQ